MLAILSDQVDNEAVIRIVDASHSIWCSDWRSLHFEDIKIILSLNWLFQVISRRDSGRDSKY